MFACQTGLIIPNVTYVASFKNGYINTNTNITVDQNISFDNGIYNIISDKNKLYVPYQLKHNTITINAHIPQKYMLSTLKEVVHMMKHIMSRRKYSDDDNSNKCIPVLIEFVYYLMHC